MPMKYSHLCDWRQLGEVVEAAAGLVKTAGRQSQDMMVGT